MSMVEMVMKHRWIAKGLCGKAIWSGTTNVVGIHVEIEAMICLHRWVRFTIEARAAALRSVTIEETFSSIGIGRRTLFMAEPPPGFEISEAAPFGVSMQPVRDRAGISPSIAALW